MRLTTRKRRFLWFSAIAGGIAIGVPLLAGRNVRREQAERQHLGDQLFRVVRGNGDPVVFLAGFQGSTRYWGGTFDSLSPTHRLIYVDALGFGRSPWPDAAYTLEDHLDALRRTLVAEGATRNVTIVGYSFGTLLAAYYAQQYPGDVRRLVLIGVPAFPDEESAKARIREMSSLAALFSLNRPIAFVGCTFICAGRPALIRLAPRLLPHLDPRVARDSLLHRWESIDGTLQSVLLQKPLAAALANNTDREVVIIHGRGDRVTPIAEVRQLARNIGASLIETAGEHDQYLRQNSALIVRTISAHTQRSTP